MNILRICVSGGLAVALSCGVAVCQAKSSTTFLRTPKEFNPQLAAIPARGDILGRVMFRLGMDVAYVTVADLGPAGGHDKAASRKVDKAINIYLKRAPAGGCPMVQPITFIQHDGAYVPESRGGNYLMTGVCALPSQVSDSAASARAHTLVKPN